MTRTWRGVVTCLAALLVVGQCWAAGLSVEASNINPFSGTAGPTVSLTALTPGTIILLCQQNNTGSLNTISSISGGGLTWHLRKQGNYTNVNVQDIEVWWAFAGSGSTFNATITVTLSASATNGLLIAASVTGANTTTPFDVNGSLPQFASSTSASTPTTTGMSTTAANTMFYGCAGGNSGSAPSAGSGYTRPQASSPNSWIAFQYQNPPNTSIQSSASEAFGSSVAGVWGMIGDAIQAAPTSVLMGRPTGPLIH